MMGRTIFPAFFLAFLLAVMGVAVAGFGVNLQVTSTMEADTRVVGSSGGNGVPNVWTVNAMNTGSQAFVGQFRLEVSREGDSEVTWSDAFVLEPGTETSRDLAFYRPGLNGSLNSSIRLVYGGRESQPINGEFTARQRNVSEGFRVTTATVIGDEMHLGIIAPADVERFFVNVDGESTRRFGQAAVSDPGRYAHVSIPHHPEIEESLDTRVELFDSRGRYHYTGEHEVRREEHLVPSLAKHFDRISGVLHAFFTRGK